MHQVSEQGSNFLRGESRAYLVTASQTKKGTSMSRMKLVFAVLLLTTIVGVVPQAHAQAPIIKIIIAGSSAMWQSMALAAYKGNNTQGQCVSGGTAPCFHYTNSSFSLNDTRPKLKGGNAIVDKNAIWIVWD